MDSLRKYSQDVLRFYGVREVVLRMQNRKLSILPGGSRGRVLINTPRTSEIGLKREGHSSCSGSLSKGRTHENAGYVESHTHL
jgi:hypothetical protein